MTNETKTMSDIERLENLALDMGLGYVEQWEMTSFKFNEGITRKQIAKDLDVIMYSGCTTGDTLGDKKTGKHLGYFPYLDGNTLFIDDAFPEFIDKAKKIPYLRKAVLKPLSITRAGREAGVTLDYLKVEGEN